jgi:diguanylate cyclase
VKALEQELVDVSDLVRMDLLSQILNRRGVAETFVTQRARAEREGKPLAVALLDIDNFKCLNDSLGHQAGDMALKYIASMVRAAVRPCDTVARYGGEEFVILLDDTSAAGAEVVLKRLQRQLTRAIFLHDDEKVLITFSAGITAFIHGDSQDSVIRRADVALYAAKAAGKNCVRTG